MIQLSSIATLTELLEQRAAHTPAKTAFIIDETSYTYEWLWGKCQDFAALLKAEKVLENETVLAIIPNSPEFFIAFYGCLLRGAVVVPVFPGAGTERCHQLTQLCGSKHVILPSNISEEREKEFTNWASQHEVNIHYVDKTNPKREWVKLPTIDADKIAFIQYTSGSTDFPKGVPLTHYNLLENIRQMVDAMQITADDVFVSWLPVYHDMGLILKTMAPFYTGACLVLLSEGLHKVHSWLKSIEEYGGTFVAAPDVAYRLCVKSIRRPEDYDLSSLRVALNASERVRLETYRLFESKFKLKNVMVAGYGLAEATVGVSMHPPGVPPVCDELGYVASGKALKGVEIRIDTSDPEWAGARGEGEILVKSKSLMKGYYNSKAGPDPFSADGFLKTGDLGYLDPEGNLFILARKKNCIKHAGHTIYPDDVEQVIKSVEGIRQAAVVGLDITPEMGESLYAFVESRLFGPDSESRYHDLSVEIVEKIKAHFGIRPGRVFIVKPKTIPRTPNGKLQHAQLRELFQNNRSSFDQLMLYPRL